MSRKAGHADGDGDGDGDDAAPLFFSADSRRA
jgi:hypothetical protein